MDLTLHIWRQPNQLADGRLVSYPVKNISADSSFLEMLDILNDELIEKGEPPVAFDDDCREGICGMCSLVINGIPHGPDRGATVCQLHMRKFSDGENIYIEPWRAKAFPVLRDLITDRGAFDRIVQAGGYISEKCGAAPDANAIPIPKDDAETAMEAAACIGCGACVAACKNASAMLFVAAKTVHFARLPQGQPERKERVLGMIEQMDKEGFGNCTNLLECEAVCPKEIPATFIGDMNREFLKAAITKPTYG
ncbi:MAG: succinate dehydrogenase/fumarate reductase iron-sulfur subunit [Planctomycetota bacterium]|jgi:succinate dehydrogenase / fumarate reductase iron-sulfur subunit